MFDKIKICFNAWCGVIFAGEIELQKRIQQYGGDYETAKVYVPNDKWCSVVITTTCIENGFDFKKLKLKEVLKLLDLVNMLSLLINIQQLKMELLIIY